MAHIAPNSPHVEKNNAYRAWIGNLLQTFGYSKIDNETGKEVGITKSERSNLMACHRNRDAIIEWYNNQPMKWRLDHNHPTRILAAWKKATGQTKAKDENKETPQQKLVRANKELVERNDMLEKELKASVSNRILGLGLEIGEMVKRIVTNNSGLIGMSAAKREDFIKALRSALISEIVKGAAKDDDDEVPSASKPFPKGPIKDWTDEDRRVVREHLSKEGKVWNLDEPVPQAVVAPKTKNELKAEAEEKRVAKLATEKEKAKRQRLKRGVKANDMAAERPDAKGRAAGKGRGNAMKMFIKVRGKDLYRLNPEWEKAHRPKTPPKPPKATKPTKRKAKVRAS